MRGIERQSVDGVQEQAGEALGVGAAGQGRPVELGRAGPRGLGVQARGQDAGQLLVGRCLPPWAALVFDVEDVMVRWLVLMSKPRQEAKLERALEMRDIEVYAPYISYTGKRGQELEKAFFPGYLFARVDLDSGQAAKLPWTPGLARLLRFGEEPAWIPDAELDYLRARIEGIDGDEFLAIKPGERVRVTHGPFRDYEAIFEGRLNGEGRVAVLLDILGRKTRVKLEGHDLERVGP